MPLSMARLIKIPGASMERPSSGHSHGLVSVRNELAQNTQPGDLGIVGDTDTADVIFRGRNLASAPCAMPVVGQGRLRLIPVIVEVVGTGSIVVGFQVAAIHVKAVVDDGHGRVLAGDALHPDTCHIDVVALLNRVEKMPLHVEDGVVDSQRLHELLLLLRESSVDLLPHNSRLWLRLHDGRRRPFLPRCTWDLSLCKANTIEDIESVEVALPSSTRLDLGLDNIMHCPFPSEDVVAVEAAQLPLVPQA
ncbi:hypothetical protein BN1708_007088 [Verticillium longisporum]|uniref:Uncharacterized protein n=1 Tax=Verticillium longisporum TaxID=100787 RepID=A0A0G4MR60_VERLO|nr:hypothetical protein BN1708_007088 [Verticillium longisporum]